jgi:Fungal specific transcription factor domain
MWSFLTLCHRVFAFYRDVSCTIYPVIPDTASFEANLNTLLTHRAYSGGIHITSADGVERPFGMSLSWLGLLFAVLASGTQSSNQPAKERELTSQVYSKLITASFGILMLTSLVCCAYQALRMTNFMTHPSVETIQAFLVIGNVLSYNMNPGVAYILLGLTVRIAFSLGLQIESHHFPLVEQYLRRYVWWVLAWQDSHFSISYDRPSSTTLLGPEIPSPQSSSPGHRGYAETMMRIVKLTQELVRGRILTPKATMTIIQIVSCKDKVARIVADGEIHLRDRNQCFNQTQHLQRLALKLHSSYITSELCRPALKSIQGYSTSQSASGRSPGRGERSFGSPGDISTAHLRQECIVNLKRVIKAYLEIHSICSLAARSWIGLQRTVSAAFLLVLQEESRQDPKVRSLLRDLEAVISERNRTERTFFDRSELQSPTLPNKSTVPGLGSKASGSSDQDMANAPHWARSMTESLKALSNLNVALAGPANGAASPNLGAYNRSGPLPSIDYAGRISGPRNDPNTAGGSFDQLLKSEHSAPGMFLPITPDSASTFSGDWTFGNMIERVGELVQPALWE